MSSTSNLDGSQSKQTSTTPSSSDTDCCSALSPLPSSRSELEEVSPNTTSPETSSSHSNLLSLPRELHDLCFDELARGLSESPASIRALREVCSYFSVVAEYAANKLHQKMMAGPYMLKEEDVKKIRTDILNRFSQAGGGRSFTADPTLNPIQNAPTGQISTLSHHQYIGVNMKKGHPAAEDIESLNTILLLARSALPRYSLLQPGTRIIFSGSTADGPSVERYAMFGALAGQGVKLYKSADDGTVIQVKSSCKPVRVTDADGTEGDGWMWSFSENEPAKDDSTEALGSVEQSII